MTHTHKHAGKHNPHRRITIRLFFFSSEIVFSVTLPGFVGWYYVSSKSGLFVVFLLFFLFVHSTGETRFYEPRCRPSQETALSASFCLILAARNIVLHVHVPEYTVLAFVQLLTEHHEQRKLYKKACVPRHFIATNAKLRSLQVDAGIW